MVTAISSALKVLLHYILLFVLTGGRVCRGQVLGGQFAEGSFGKLLICPALYYEYL